MTKNNVLVALLLFTFAFTVIALTFKVGFAIENVVIIWPAAAINYWAIRRYNRLALLPMLLADICHAYFILELPLLYSLTSLGNTLAAWAGVNVERYYLKASGNNRVEGRFFDSPRTAYASLIGGFLTLSICSALIGAAVIQLINPPADLGYLVWRWVLADYTGLIILAPTLVYFSEYWKTKSLNRQSITNIAACIAALVVMALLVNYKIIVAEAQHMLVLLISPLVVWLVFQSNTERICLTLSAFSIGTLAISLSMATRQTELVWLNNQLFITQILLIGYILHTINLQRNRLTSALSQEKRYLENRVKERTKDLENEISERKKIAAQLQQIASTDELTGIANRRSFFQQLNIELSRIKRGDSALSVILLDIDRFKLINDTYGHGAGDIVLQQLCNCINEQVREKIDIFARVGGEEFAILLPQTPTEGAQIFGERCRAAIENMDIAISLENGEIKHLSITGSFGAVECQNGDTDSTLIMAQADKALYQAKENGRNKLVLADVIT